MLGGNTNRLSAMVPLIILLSCAIAFIAIVVFSPKYTNKELNANRYARSNRVHRKLITNPITRRRYVEMVEILSQLSLFSREEIRRRAQTAYFVSESICWVVYAAGIWVFRDFVCEVLIVSLGSLVKTVYFTFNVKKLRRAVLNEFDLVLSSIGEKYAILGTIPDALAECQKGKYLQQQIEEIYSICSANDGRARLEAFQSKCQFRQLKTLAESCYVTHDMGDTYDHNNASKFNQTLQLIKDEVELAIRGETLTKLQFNYLELMPIAPLFAWSAIANSTMTNVPATVVWYNGIPGYISKIIMIVTGMYGFYYITHVTDVQYVASNDRLYFIEDLLRIRWFDKLVTNVEPKDSKTRMKVTNKIEHSLSTKDLHYIYAEKILFGTATFLLALLFSVTIVLTSRQVIYRNVESLSIIGSGNEYSDKEKKQLFEYDKTILQRKNLESDEVMVSQLKNILTKAPEMSLYDEVTRVRKKYEAYHKTYYRWWYVLVCYVIGIFGWTIPMRLIKFRTSIVKSAAEEDVLQMQTVIASLMDTSLDTLSILQWMEEDSVIHKDIIAYCVNEYTSDPEKAITRMQRNSVIPAFHRMCDKLLTTIHQISFAEAFSDLVSERAHIMKVREMVQEHSILAKRRKCSKYAMMPLYLLFILGLLLPLAVIGGRDFMTMFKEYM